MHEYQENNYTFLQSSLVTLNDSSIQKGQEE